MRGRFCRIALFALTGVLSAGVLSGCVQMTRHSNTLVFGTNTSFGIRVGQDATASPGITVGYSRQEAVVMPLVVNTSDDGQTQKPCPQLTTDADMSATGIPTSCRLVGMSRANEYDSYSVLASFGAKFGGELNGSGQSATGQIAQYFATGLAARKLAENGGAATVALGGAATSAALRLHGISEDDIPTTDDLMIEARAIAEARATVANKVATKGSGFRPFLATLDQGAKTGTQFTRACPGAADAAVCSAVIANSASLPGVALSQWALAKAVQ